jgi:hypothetical protein
MARCLFAFCCSSLVLPLAISAQDPSTAQVGESVHVRARNVWFSATYDGIRNDSIVLARNGEEWFVISIDSVEAIEGERCCKTRWAGTRNGALWGAAIGTGVGIGSAVLGCATDRYLCDLKDGEFRKDLALFTLTRAAIGAAIGGIWGNRKPGNTWMRLEPPSIGVGLEPDGAPRLVFGLRGRL